MAASLTEDTIITIPAAGGAARVEVPGGRGGRDVFFCAPNVVGQLLANIEEGAGLSRTTWIDLLGATTPGIAISRGGGRNAVWTVLAFPARQKQVRHVDYAQLTWNLPPTTWVVKWNTAGGHVTSWLFAGPTRITSVTDTQRVVAFPFGNVYDHGQVCWGNVVLTTLNISDPLAIDNVFFASRFNHDLVALRVFMVNGHHPDADGGWLDDLDGTDDTRLEIAANVGGPFTRKLSLLVGGNE